ncbi:MAG TPA: hypothetical protein VG144_13400 [Gaiellaceae bacterium]|nr:hypothetical protein [Gaiellaceae bacterium]
MRKKPDGAQLVAALRAVGCPDPEAWAQSELEEDIPQFARYLLCKTIWEHGVEPWRDEATLDAFPEARALVDAGADREQLRLLGGKIAYETMTAIVNAIDEGTYVGPAAVPDDAPGWVIVELDGRSLKPTGRKAGFIHESILSVDPTGTEGAEFRR